MNVVPYGALLISRLNDLRDSANLQPWSQMLEKNSPTPPFNVGVEIRVHRLRSYIQHWTGERGKFPRQYVHGCLSMRIAWQALLMCWNVENKTTGDLRINYWQEKMKGSWIKMCYKLLAFSQRNEDYAKKALIGCDDNLFRLFVAFSENWEQNRSAFRWSPQIIPWHDLLLMLEGQPVHLPAPKSHFCKDIVFDKDTPIFGTSKHELVFVRGGVVARGKQRWCRYDGEFFISAAKFRSKTKKQFHRAENALRV